ncbi:TIGR03118 family protein [Granulicella sp. S190]|uniref:TIGR03118 family protein n=1 Tax=Granulicella sp. S190 TaxID=1747226 RepID=UPI00131CBC4D|nr:TIGR03118 family protein [Granulicella sp. S190]
MKNLLALLLSTFSLAVAASAQTAGSFQATNILSDGSVTAAVTDPQFINPWGVSVGPAFWINTQASGLDYVATATGTIPFKVSIPTAAGTGTGSPTGTVFSPSTTNFKLPNGSAATFLFATLDGTVSGWNSALGTTNSVAQIAINNSAANAVYTDIALLTNPTGTFLLAANFGAGTAIEVYDTTFKAAKLAGSFTDTSLPANYAPFAVHVIGNQVFVTYALRSTNTGSPASPTPYAVSSTGVHAAATTYLQTVGAGNGIVDVFDLSGDFVSRAITGGNLNAPWGVALAPTGFGIYGGDLLVGNFGDGIINVYNPSTFAYLGQITDATGKPLAFASLWEIVFGQSNATPAGAGDPNTLYIAAGLANEGHGLFAGIANTTSSTAAANFGFSASTSAATVTAGNSTTATISVAPTNSFAGNVTLSCSGPAGVTCTFSPSSLTVTPTAAATSTVTIQTAAAVAHLKQPAPWGKDAATVAVAFFMPFGSILVFSRRRAIGKTNPLQLLGLFALLLISTGLVVGCSGSSNPTAAQGATPPASPSTPSTPGTPTGVQMVTVTATSGSLTQNTTIALTVQ